MTRVVFVCHGNICRSPMAEAIFCHMLEERGLTGTMVVDSAAVSAEELGHPVYPQAQQQLQQHGLPRSRHRAWQLSRSDYDRFDYFLGMDLENIHQMQRLFGGDPQGKVKLLMRYTAHPDEVEDPWYTGRFDEVFHQIEKGCSAFLDALLSAP